MSVLLEFDTLNNIRDLGGARAGDGRTIRTGRLIRSGHLAAVSRRDRERLSGLVDTVLDLRTSGERREQPDRDIPGAVSYHIPIMDELAPGVTREEAADRSIFADMLCAPEEALEHMCRLYRSFALSDYSVFSV
jgi:protein-tyrosine phosphatase